MNLNYAIFRSEPIMTLPDLAQIGSHNKREKKAYNSNPDIKIELSHNNIELVPLSDKYSKWSLKINIYIEFYWLYAKNDYNKYLVIVMQVVANKVNGGGG